MNLKILATLITKFLCVLAISMTISVGIAQAHGGGGGGDGKDTGTRGKPQLTDAELVELLRDDIRILSQRITSAVTTLQDNERIIRRTKKPENDPVATQLRQQSIELSNVIVEAVSEIIFWQRIAGIRPSESLMGLMVYVNKLLRDQI